MDSKRRELLKMAGIGAAAATVGVLPAITGLGGEAQAATLTINRLSLLAGDSVDQPWLNI